MVGSWRKLLVHPLAEKARRWWKEKTEEEAEGRGDTPWVTPRGYSWWRGLV